MNPRCFGVIGPGFLNQAPTLHCGVLSFASWVLIRGLGLKDSDQGLHSECTYAGHVHSQPRLDTPDVRITGDSSTNSDVKTCTCTVWSSMPLYGMELSIPRQRAKMAVSTPNKHEASLRQ